jgi:ElaB/YqjD/DUF883 family membrane-anchored ribosome-binding protein
MERYDEPGSPGGSSEVHSELSVNPSKGEGMSGRLDEGGAADQPERGAPGMRGRAAEAKNRVADAREQVSERADEIRGRAREKVGRMKTQAEHISDDAQARATRALNESGAKRKIDTYPLAALGVAFGAGFLLAGSGSEKNGRLNKTKHQIRGALMTAATAAIAREARSMLGMESGQSGGLADLFGGSRGGSGEASRSTRNAEGSARA